MTVAMSAQRPALTALEIESLERQIGAQLPESYKHFLETGNVVTPASNQFQGQGMSGSVSKFLGASSVANDDLAATQVTYTDRLPGHVLPVALAGGGNLVCIYLQNGRVYLWDHEQDAGDGEVASFDNMHYVAESFSSFLAALEPFDADKVELDPKDIVSVKLKPGFAERFKDFKL